MNSVKKIKEWLNTFTPFNEQEQVDCQRIRQFLEEEENLLLRDNVKMHFTASAWVLNPSKNKVLMLYHNIYQSWSWSGGHADGEGDLLSVAMKEVKEESGLVSLKPLSDSPISIEILGVQPHYKKQKYVSAHLHLNYTFLLHNTKEEKLKICPEENSKVGWLSPDEAVRSSTEAWMKPIYKKLNQKMKEYL
ncbi:NUDIX hydrolase [Anaerobutyricum hallii]|uniref:NUDIX hydrolase n=1 Tax=Anaerobutyricum hallii TaxID=39488 RepID=UPI0039A3563B